ncbi:hypothetical protein BVG16_13190 [Paenibacillus selenitireducens]|uniref:Aminoglycoside phosphotransferase domain-containing protein n=1 Tax=Paenibacillus selenitireducens TaxID=1324314 RepID=A0A1T2XC39_9BACL|nr:phosphotransferase [Paenibacillus selenitireducens]OPA77410.1 hypothetical protein BVG16_13190 [Paenibacillus selenitireducens]
MITPAVLQEVCAYLGCESTDLKLLGGYHNHVFEVHHNGRQIIVKILQETYTTKNQVLAEVAWLVELLHHGQHVVKPLLLDGRDYITDLSGDFFFAAYEKVEGIHIQPQHKNVWNAEIFEQWGEALGSIHALSKTYKPQHHWPQWSEHPLLKADIISEDPQIMDLWTSYVTQFKSLPTMEDNYGLIHGDLHHHNLMYTEQGLTLIDFGDAEYHWFAYDMAISIYHAVQTVPRGKERNEFAFRFFDSLMKGYARTNSSTAFISQIDLFIDYRYLFSYTYHSVFSDQNQWTEQQRLFIENMRLSLIHDPSYLGFKLLV